MKNKDDITANKKSSEIVRYLFWGVISSVLNVGLFQMLNNIGFDYKISNVVTLFFVKLFCYVTNKIFVFKSDCYHLIGLFREFASFMLARVITFFVDYFGVILLVELVGVNLLISKISMTLFVVLINYVLSKWFVFKKDGEV